MSKKVRKAISWITILGVIAVIGLIAVLNPEAPEVKADVSTSSVTVGNAAPIASDVHLNNDGAIILNEGSGGALTSVSVTSTVTDNNGCGDLTQGGVKITIYKSGTSGGVDCTANNNNCYTWSTTSVSWCSGTSGDITHTFDDVHWYADPGTWIAEVEPSDESAGTNASSSQTLNSTAYLDVAAAINYGSVDAGATSSADVTAAISNTGNADIDAKVSSAEAMSCDGEGTIPVANQHYATTTGVAWESGTVLSETPTDLGLTISKQTTGDSVTATDDSYWRVKVDTGTEGTCTGTDTFAVVSK